jgi:hypothetical protein
MTDPKLYTNINPDGTINIQMHHTEVAALLDVLSFASMAAKHLSFTEMEKGTYQGTLKLQGISRDAKELHHIFTKNLDIGEPLSDGVN